ncbi:MAG: dephospho-CoA kinase, partial [Candidatus Muiribacterium halophilum]
MLTIGISGKIGSGKSLLSSFFLEREDSYVVDCEKLASKLMEGDSEILKKIQKTFGEESVVNGMLNR